MNQDFYACHLFEFLRKENPLVSFCTMHFTGGFNYRLRIRRLREKRSVLIYPMSFRIAVSHVKSQTQVFWI